MRRFLLVLVAAVSVGFLTARPAVAATFVVTTSQDTVDISTDLFLYNSNSGVWVESFSDGAGDFTYAVGQWDPGWTVRVTDFDADGRADILVSRPDGVWVQATNIANGTFWERAGNWGTGWTVFTRKAPNR